jgi:hypothetical protein
MSEINYFNFFYPARYVIVDTDVTHVNWLIMCHIYMYKKLY